MRMQNTLELVRLGFLESRPPLTWGIDNECDEGLPP